ncbi:hypothetical protein P885DRAFT_69259 [Corynascus similis CBS 632.67]
MFGPGLVAGLTAFSSVALGQSVWDTDQISTRICQWQQLRAAVLRDTVYLDGGYLTWQPGYADGHLGRPTFDNNLAGYIYTLNFSTPFNITQNITAILGTLETGGGDTNSRAPNYQDGALLGNDAQFCLYGGMLTRSIRGSEPPGDSVLCYQAYQYGVEKPNFRPGFVTKDLGEDVTRYVTYGGAASAPSENLAWYFSGLRSPTSGSIWIPGNDESTHVHYATVVSDTLITVDMSEQLNEKFSNDTLQPNIPGRANPELVWVPVGSRGILVALGGVVYPDWVNATTKHSANETASKLQSPEFMSTIDIYDVDSGKWYRQRTTGGPEQLTRGCAVVARAQDGSSFNIYYYGGYDGLNMGETYNDDVWVLSLPSFTWVKLTSSTGEGRAGHKCVMPYPDQMLVIGGTPPLKGLVSCLQETIRVFNLSTGRWLDRYDPAVYANYTVPSAVVAKIGGSGTGGATATSPSPSWGSRELASIFAEEYPTSKITTYYPYASNGPVDNTNPDVPPPAEQDEGGGLPSYLPPVLGVVLGLVFLTMVAVLILLWRRRRLLRRGGAISEAGTEDTNKHRIASWLRGQSSASPEVKAPTMASSSDYSPLASADPEHSVAQTVTPLSIAEMMNTEVQLPAELPDTSPPAELHSATTPSPTARTAATVSAQASLNNNEHYSSTHQTDYANSSSTHPTPPPNPQVESPIFYRPDSDALGQAPGGTSATTTPTSAAAGRSASGRSNKVLSGISNISERDRMHLRQISDTTVSSVTTAPNNGGNGGSNNVEGGGGRDRVLSSVSALSSVGGYVIGDGSSNRGGVGGLESPAAISPPTATAGPGEGADYLGVRPSGGQTPASPLRRSIFSENLDGSTAGDGGQQQQQGRGE